MYTPTLSLSLALSLSLSLSPVLLTLGILLSLYTQANNLSISYPHSRTCRWKVKSKVLTAFGFGPHLKSDFVITNNDKFGIKLCHSIQIVGTSLATDCTQTTSTREAIPMLLLLQLQLWYWPWWWSSGQRAHLLLRRSEFESRWGLQFFCKIVIEKNENKQKRGRGWPIFF